MFNLSPDASYEQNRLFKTLLKKRLEFDSNRKNDTIAFNLSFILLPIKINFIRKNQGYKKNEWIICSTDYIKITLKLLTKIIASYI